MDKAMLLKLVKSLAVWLHGLGAAFIGGAANSIVVAQIVPEAVNFGSQWKKAAAVAVASGVISAAFYLKLSPLPGLLRSTPTTEEKQS